MYGISQSVGLPDRFYATIEYKVTDPSKLTIPQCKPEIEKHPFTGKGFTGSKIVVMPQYVQSSREFVNGDIINIIDSKTGKMTQKFIYDDEFGWKD